ncbi:MAG: hypothetical protein IK045_09105 [Bacteroidales bacterium]|nr:hypothetical protein [Bacteroidales bacterium]
MKWLRNLLKGASLTTALFVFEACYGPPHGGYLEYELPIEFLVVSAEDEKPLKDIKISHKGDVESDWYLCGATEEDGRFCTIIDRRDGPPQFRFNDSENVFAPKDTVLESWDHVIVVKLQKQGDTE